MGKEIVRHIWNAISGMFVLLLSLWMSGPGIGETDTPTYRWYFMLLVVLWLIGFVLQFKKRSRLLGVVITLIPVIYYLSIYILAAFM
ncbi:hypothetical protein M3197_11865 [Sporosarcina aquimarina]|uniref:hypothetical protein n=1 Tax=Sporosarcina aquimarina TaxID=114975 RepID=UPI00203FC39C|nr:hypothetical protein [Sporosarcina aquimarina]MCM3758160.1 hypothetical protein [Sporosarcina aquimarina]